MSEAKVLTCSMPQGSIFGPKGYPAYVAPLFKIAHHYNISMHMYADDTQLYVKFDVDMFAEVKAIGNF